MSRSKASDTNYGRPLSISLVTIFRGTETKVVLKTDVDTYLKDGWNIVASTRTKEPQP